MGRRRQVSVLTRYLEGMLFLLATASVFCVAECLYAAGAFRTSNGRLALCTSRVNIQAPQA